VSHCGHPSLIPVPMLWREVVELMRHTPRCGHTTAARDAALRFGGVLVCGSASEAARTGDPPDRWYQIAPFNIETVPSHARTVPRTISLADLQRKPGWTAGWTGMNCPILFDNSAMLELADEVVRWDIAVARVLNDDVESAHALYRVAEDRDMARMTAELEMALVENQRLREQLEAAERDAAPVRRERDAAPVRRERDAKSR
jgi:hypothetical protein